MPHPFLVPTYSPLAELAQHFPDWTITFVPGLPYDELVDFDNNSILLNPGDDPEYRAAHAVSHLFLGHSYPFSKQDHDDATGRADMYLDGTPIDLLGLHQVPIEHAPQPTTTTSTE